jgi:hypothetical protein
MDIHVTDPKTQSKIVLRYEIKTEGARKSRNQKEADDILEWMGYPVHEVHVDLATGNMTVDGNNADIHFGQLRRRFGRH